MPNFDNRRVIDRILPWMAGITMPLLVIALSALWGVSNQMSAYASENEVFKLRVSQNERAMLDIKSSTNEIVKAVTEMKVIQSTHNALMQAEVEHMKNDMKDLSEYIRQQRLAIKKATK
jgi:hypothetical protein